LQRANRKLREHPVRKAREDEKAALEARLSESNKQI